MLVRVRLKRLVLLTFLLGRLRAAHAQFGEVALRLHGALVDGTVLQAQTQHGRGGLPAVEDALDLAVQFEKVVLPEAHLAVLNLHGLLDRLLQIHDHLVGSLRLDVLIDVAVRADRLQLNQVVSLKT